MDTIFLGNDDQKNLVGSKFSKFCSLCRLGLHSHHTIWLQRQCPVRGIYCELLKHSTVRRLLMSQYTYFDCNNTTSASFTIRKGLFDEDE